MAAQSESTCSERTLRNREYAPNLVYINYPLCYEPFIRQSLERRLIGALSTDVLLFAKHGNRVL